jgi:hypothetical protein
VTVSGSLFQSGAGVSIGGSAAGGVSVEGPDRISANTPALPPGTLNDVAVTNPIGVGGILPGAFLADFSDVPGSQPFHDFIEAIFRSGVTAGCGDGGYCPASSVPRSQMAVFLLKASERPGYLPPAATGVFDDVPSADPFAPWIEELYRRGITAGCSESPLRYCPGSPVTRAQMAVFLLKTLLGAAYVPPPAAGLFGDVPASDPFARWIEDFRGRGITAGCQASPLLYCPDAASTRGQMAVFLARTFGLGP